MPAGIQVPEVKEVHSTTREETAQVARACAERSLGDLLFDGLPTSSGSFWFFCIAQHEPNRML